MKTAWLIGLVMAAGALPVAAQNGKVAWKRDPKPAMEEAKKSGKAMMLYFTSEG